MPPAPWAALKFVHMQPALGALAEGLKKKHFEGVPHDVSHDPCTCRAPSLMPGPRDHRRSQLLLGDAPFPTPILVVQ